MSVAPGAKLAIVQDSDGISGSVIEILLSVTLPVLTTSKVNVSACPAALKLAGPFLVTDNPGMRAGPVTVSIAVASAAPGAVAVAVFTTCPASTSAWLTT